MTEMLISTETDFAFLIPSDCIQNMNFINSERFEPLMIMQLCVFCIPLDMERFYVVFYHSCI